MKDANLNDIKGADQENFLSWIVAFQICFQYLCVAFSFSGVSVLLEFVMGCVLLYGLVTGKIKITVSYLVIVLFIIMTFIFSLLFLSDIEATIDYFVRFLFYEVIALLLGFQMIDKKSVLSKVVLMGTIFLPFILSNNVLGLDSGNQMGFAYACLPVFVVSIFGLFYGKKIMCLSVVNLLMLMYEFMTYAPRGIWLIIATVVCSYIYWIICNKLYKVVGSMSIVLVLTAFFAMMYYLLNNLVSIIVVLTDLLDSAFNIKIYALDKFLRYYALDNVSNDREYIWYSAFELIKESPFIGTGIGYFESISGGAYCHNILIEAFCETGIFFGIPVLLYIIALIIRFLKSTIVGDESDFQWLILTFCIGVEVLLVSSSYWMYPLFWFFLGSFIRDTRITERYRK